MESPTAEPDNPREYKQNVLIHRAYQSNSENNSSQETELMLSYFQLDISSL